ncbi:MAG: methyltransferase [Bacteroidota bacterium]
MNVTSKFEFKQVDAEGHETLDAIEAADKFNGWMYRTIRPYCSGNILEVGSGIGNISGFFLRDKHPIFLTDVRGNYCDILQKNFKGNSTLLGIEQLDLVHPEFGTRYAHLLERFDTVFALNVVEHIENDNLALANASRLLRPGGTLIILVPAWQFLYNRFDKELCHYKRYVKKQLEGLFTQNGLQVKRSMYFNALGILGWFVSGRLMKNKVIPRSQMSFYNRIVPVARLIDRCLFRKIGLSVITIGTK